MGEITLTCGGRHVTLAPGQTITLGRGLDCDVILTDTVTSRRHVQVTNHAGTAVLRDLGSSNGTWIGGRRIAEPTRLPAGHRAMLGGNDGVELSIVAPQHYPTRTQQPAPTVTIGRGLDNDIVLDDLLVSRRHVRLDVGQEGGYTVTDLGSRNGTYINGKRVDTGPLADGDLLTIGHSRFGLRSGRLIASVDDGDIELVVSHLGYETARGEVLLEDVDFVLDGAGLLAVVGPSGAGKTTLLNALTGARPATHGDVFYDGRSLYANFDDLRHRIGVVPQDDVVHTRLTVHEALQFAAELRFPDDLDPALRQGRVDEVLDELGLTPQAHTRIDHLSGGQRKRTSVALELLTRPSLLFLDEPTSGLDPGLDKQVMQTLRELADAGRTVVVITHNIASLGLCDKVLVLAPGGRVAYFGAPDEVLHHFGFVDWADVFTQVSQDPEGAAHRYRRAAAAAPRTARPPRRRADRMPADRAIRQQSIRSQLSTLVRRHTRLILADQGYAAFIVLLPVALALLAAVMPGSGGLSTPGFGSPGPETSARSLLLVLVIGAIFMGITVSARELIGERTIFDRERAVGLSPTAYLCSKLAVFAVITLVQTSLLVVLVRLVKAPADGALIFGAPTLELIVVCWVAALGAVSLGLLFSSLATTAEQVMPLLAGAVMAQLVLSGGLFTLEGGLRIVAAVVPSRWNFAAGASSVDLTGIAHAHGLFGSEDPLWLHSRDVLALDLIGGLAFLVLFAVLARMRIARAQP